MNEKVEQIKNQRDILEQIYVTAEDLQMIMPTLKYTTALAYIKDAQEEMKSKNIFVPKSKTKMALTKIIRKRFGI